MPYCKAKDREKARFNAVREVLREGRSQAEVARRFGVYRSTISRWVKKFRDLEEAHEISWHCDRIPTFSARPKCSPRKISAELENRIIEARAVTQRCAEVVWGVLRTEGVTVSLATVNRVLSRNHLTRERGKWVRKRQFSPRPLADSPGALVEVDTVHFYHPVTKTRRYATTVLDVYTRLAYVKIHDGITQEMSVRAVLEASQYFEFTPKVIQTDNGSEFGKRFQDQMKTHGIRYRHTRVRKPNDNAHIERFNRTLREECLGDYLPEKESNGSSQARVKSWLDHYNHHRLHLGLQFMSPIQMLRRC